MPRSREAHLPHAGVGEQALDVALSDGHKVAHQHGDGGKDGDDDLPVVHSGHEALTEETQHQGEGSGLRADSQVGGDWKGGALVDVGGPHVEGDGRHLEAQPHQYQGETDPEGGADSFSALQEFKLGSDVGVAGDAKHAVEHAEAEKQDGRGEASDEDVLDTGLVGLGIVSGIRGHDIEAEAHQLKGDVGRQQLPGGGHGRHGKDGQDHQA